MQHKLFSPYPTYEPKSGDPVLLDKYTLAHLLGGYLMQKFGLSDRVAVLLALGYELVEDQLIKELGLKRWKVEGKGNALVDVVAAIAGYHFAAYRDK